MTFSWQRCRARRWQWLVGLALSTMLLIIALPSWAVMTPQQDMQRLDSYIQTSLSAIEKPDAETYPNAVQAASIAFDQYKTQWFDVEDNVKKSSRQAYKDIETAMGEVKFAFSTNPPNVKQIALSLKQLQAVNQKFIAGSYSVAQTVPESNVTSNNISIDSLLERLKRAEAAIAKNDVTTAGIEVKAFQADWLAVEGVVAAKSREDYTSVENNMAKANGFLARGSTNVANATVAIADLKKTLQPYAGGKLRYTIFDSALILLREGMEALLVLVALMAFLNKSGNSDKSRWLWFGAGTGILASIATALIIRAVFSDLTTAGVNRELLEGGTGLFAAAMLFYVSYWLHSKSSMGAWQGYIRGQVTTALAQNSLFSLAFLAFLAVFREGGETALFYIGIAPSISRADLVGGFVVAVILLAIAAFLMLRVGLTIPLKPFFVVTSLLIYYLGFKFIGAGIHSLQVSKLLPASPSNFLPSWEGLGLYPTWETTLPQIALLLIAGAIVFRSRARSPETTA